MQCLRKIAHIKWQDHLPNTTVLTICNISGIEAFLQTAQLRWSGHVIRMHDSCIPKQVFYGQLHHGSRRPGGQYKRDKDHLKATLNQCGITPSHLETLVSDRTDWRSTCKSAVQEFESPHILELEAKRDQTKIWSANHQQLSVPDLSQDVPFSYWTYCTCQVPHEMMRPVASTAQSIHTLYNMTWQLSEPTVSNSATKIYTMESRFWQYMVYGG